MHAFSLLLATSLLQVRFNEFLHWAQQGERALLFRAACLLTCAAAGIYLMLPRGQVRGVRLQRIVGALLATISLILLVTAPVQAEPAHLATLLVPLGDQTEAACGIFHGLALISLVSAGMMITSRNPVYSALWFALVLLSNSGLYLLQSAEFLSAATIIVYAGAIIVTFLFVIMLAQPQGAASYDHVSREPVLSVVTGLILAASLVGTIHYAIRSETAETGSGRRRPSAALVAATVNDATPQNRVDPGSPHVAGLGKSLFLDHYVSVEVIALLLLAAVVGAVLIAGHETTSADEADSSGHGPAQHHH